MIKKNTAEYFLVVLLTLAGFSLRVRNLGELSFWSDDGFTFLAVEGILKNGFPLLPSGFVYGKHLFYSYFASIPVAFLGMSEFSLRLSGVLAGSLLIPAIYLAGRKLFNHTTGLIAAIYITFSVWEIEFSRQARYYSLFQLLYLLGIFYFYSGFIEEKKKHKIPALVFLSLCVFTHQLGLTLFGSFLFILLIRGWKQFFSRKVFPYVIATGVIFSSWFIVSNFFFKVGKLSPYKPGVKGILSNLFQKFSPHFFKEFQWLYPKMYYLIWVGVFFLFVELILLLRKRSYSSPESRKDEVNVPSTTLLRGAMATKQSIHKMRDCFLSRSARVRNDTGLSELSQAKHLTGWSLCSFLFVLSIVMMGYGQAHFQPRYVFYLHPVFVLLYFYTVYRIGVYVYLLSGRFLHSFFGAGWGRIIVSVFISFLITCLTVNGASPMTACRIAVRDYADVLNVKFMPSTSRAFHYDSKSVGEFVKMNLMGDDAVIAMHPIFQYIYVGRYDYWLWSTKWWPAFFKKGDELHENYTGARVIQSLPELREVLEKRGEKRIWLISSPSINQRAHISKDIADFLEGKKEKVLFRGRDRISKVFLWSTDTDIRYSYEAEGMLMRIGKNRFDGKARWKYSRSAVVSDGAGHIVYGPYQYFNSGEYKAIFRLKAAPRREEMPVCTIDVCSEGGKEILSEKVLYSRDFEGNDYQDFSLPFEIRHKKELEFRIFSHGNCEISADYIDLKEH